MEDRQRSCRDGSEVLRHLKKKYKRPWIYNQTEAQRRELTSLMPHSTELEIEPPSVSQGS